jgi:hypothetical protein
MIKNEYYYMIFYLFILVSFSNSTKTPWLGKKALDFI